MIQAASKPWDDYASPSGATTGADASQSDAYAHIGSVEHDPYAELGTEEGPRSNYTTPPPKLHTWQLKGRDGKVIQYTAPEDATDEQIQDAAAKAAGVDPSHINVNRAGLSAVPPQNHSALDGFVGGLTKPIDNISGWIDNIPGVHEASDYIAHATGLPTAAEANAEHQAFRDDNSRTGWQGVGGFVGTLPTMALPGGVLAQGAAGGALLSNHHSAGGIAADAGLAALSGYGMSKAIGGVAKAIAPTVSPFVRTLLDNGVKPTFGQILRSTADQAPVPAASSGSKFGQLLAKMDDRVSSGVSRYIANSEDRATSLPFAGESIAEDRARAAIQFRKGAVQQALTPIGVTVPDHLQSGHGMVAFAQKQISRAYDASISRMQMIPDAQLAQDVTTLDSKVSAGGLSKPFQRRLQTDVNETVRRRIYGNGSGMMDGQELQKTLSTLRQKAQKFGSSQDAEQQEYGDALSELADHIENAASRSSPPEAVAARDAANTAYAHLVRVEGAAKNAVEGDFSPRQLDLSVRQGASRVRGRDAAAGEALMQDYSTAGARVLPSRTGSSGTAERLSAFNPYHMAVGGVAQVLHSLGKHVAVPIITRQPGQTANSAAALLRSMSPAISATAAPLTIPTSQH